MRADLYWTKHSIKPAMKKQKAHLPYNRPDKSAIAQHCVAKGHTIFECCVTILKEIIKPTHLNAWETYFVNSSNREHLRGRKFNLQGRRTDLKFKISKN